MKEVVAFGFVSSIVNSLTGSSCILGQCYQQSFTNQKLQITNSKEYPEYDVIQFDNKTNKTLRYINYLIVVCEIL